MAHLFSYGTLRQREVQISTFGRELAGVEDAVLGFELGSVEISDPKVVALSGAALHPALIRSTGSQSEVSGMVFTLSDAELASADDYEASDYERIQTTTKSGIQTFVYVAKSVR